jgi:hypothetical protein
MTAIALLNPELDPHIVADTLLSVRGYDPNPVKKIWLPALGQVQSEWADKDGPWYVSRLGRKSFFLPNGSGMLVFAGDCGAAFDFWSDFSDSFRILDQDDPEAKVTSSMLDDVLSRSKKAADFTLLGVLIDKTGHRQAYVRNSEITLSTRYFGTCHLAGSGGKFLEEMIRDADDRIEQAGGWGKNVRITATEDLAEQISSGMLYRESDPRNGFSSKTPLAAYCGGFYEWYGISADGIRPMRSRVDIHFSYQKGSLKAGRIYFVEQLENVKPIDPVAPSQRYYLTVINLGLVPYEFPSNESFNEGWTVIPEECQGVGIESTFTLYDEPARGQSTSRFSGPVTAEVI